jgi:hypothetical protein
MIYVAASQRVPFARRLFGISKRRKENRPVVSFGPFFRQCRETFSLGTNEPGNYAEDRALGPPSFRRFAIVTIVRAGRDAGGIIRKRCEICL